MWKCFKDVLVRPFLAKDPREQVVGTADTVGRVLWILHCQGDPGCQQFPALGRVGKCALQPQVSVFRLPPHAEGALETTGMCPGPTRRRSPHTQP